MRQGPIGRATSADVAKRAGVSRATVSYVVNGLVSVKVAPQTRERVLAAAAELGFSTATVTPCRRCRPRRWPGSTRSSAARPSTAPRRRRLANWCRSCGSIRTHRPITRGRPLGIRVLIRVLRAFAEERGSPIRAWIGPRMAILVPHTGFEPVISALRGRCPGPLDECGQSGAGDGTARPVGMIPDDAPDPVRGGASRGTRERTRRPAGSCSRR